MTKNEAKTIKQALKAFADAGLVSANTMTEIEQLSNEKDDRFNRPDLVSREQAAKLFNVTTRTIINWEWDGKISPIKLAGKRLVRYHFADIENLFGENINAKTA